MKKNMMIFLVLVILFVLPALGAAKPDQLINVTQVTLEKIADAESDAQKLAESCRQESQKSAKAAQDISGGGGNYREGFLKAKELFDRAEGIANNSLKWLRDSSNAYETSIPAEEKYEPHTKNSSEKITTDPMTEYFIRGIETYNEAVSTYNEAVRQYKKVLDAYSVSVETGTERR